MASKLRRVRKAMAGEKVGALVISALDDIAWLYNIRGNDVDFKTIDIFKFRDGKISDHWGVTDSGTLMMQIGAMQPPG